MLEIIYIGLLLCTGFLLSIIAVIMITIILVDDFDEWLYWIKKGRNK